MKEKILIGPSSFGVADREPIERLEGANVEIVPNPFGRKLTTSELKELLPGVTGIIAGLEPLTREVLTGSSLRVISRCGAGLDNVDLEAARERNIAVRFTPEAPTTAVAELTLGAMLALLRHLPSMNRELHDGRWSKQIGVQLEGKTVLIVGFGRIGRRVARLVRAFDAHVIVSDPSLDGTVDGAPVLPLAVALPRSDIISLHASGSKPILGALELSLVKRGAYVLNSARGVAIDEEHLRRALETKQIAGAWIDTFSEEPYRGPLSSYSQVLLTPHVGSYTAECRRRMELESVINLLDGLGVASNAPA